MKRREPALHIFADGPLAGLLFLGQRAELLHPDGRRDRHEGHGERVQRRLDVPAVAVELRGAGRAGAGISAAKWRPPSLPAARTPQFHKAGTSSTRSLHLAVRPLHPVESDALHLDGSD